MALAAWAEVTTVAEAWEGHAGAEIEGGHMEEVMVAAGSPARAGAAEMVVHTAEERVRAVLKEVARRALGIQQVVQLVQVQHNDVPHPPAGRSLPYRPTSVNCAASRSARQQRMAGSLPSRNRYFPK